MFVRVIINETDWEQRSLLYQCTRAFINPKNKDEVYLTMQQDHTEDHTVQLELSKEKSAVYFMNDDGKTIDRFNWKTTTPW